MHTQKYAGLIAGLLISAIVAALPLQAREVVHHGVAKANDVYLLVNLDTINKSSVITLCKVALTQALIAEELNVVGSRSRADVELVVNGGILTITEGRAGKIGNAQLSYSAELKDMRGHTIMSIVDATEGDSSAEACTDAAEDIASEVESALDD